MSDSNKPIKCARCDRRAELLVDANTGERAVTCGPCGVSEDLESVKRGIAEQASNHFGDSISDIFRGIARRNKNVSFTPGERIKKRWNFTVEF
jgi:transcription elongation factor Elf1